MEAREPEKDKEMYHDCYILVIDAVVVNWGLEEVSVFFEPA
jgi:hypothetical protein